VCRVRVLYFAKIRELTGIAEEELSLPEEVSTVRAFRTLLEATRPALRGKLVGTRIAVDESFANDDETIASGSVIALIPPVAGG
jgi:sulfur-carrier protein